jgi:hypothetical protein
MTKPFPPKRPPLDPETFEPIPEMSSVEFKAALKLLFDSDYDLASAWLGHTPGSKTVRRWAAGTAPVAKAVTILLRAMVHSSSDLDEIRSMASRPIIDERRPWRAP